MRRLLQLAKGQGQIIGLSKKLSPLDNVCGEQGLFAALGLHLALGLDDKFDYVLLQAVVDLGGAFLVPQTNKVHAEKEVLPFTLRHRVLP